MKSTKLQESGEICESCRMFWEAQKLAPKYMQTVFRDGGYEVITEHHGLPIAICPHCDGDVILKLRKDL